MQALTKFKDYLPASAFLTESDEDLGVEHKLPIRLDLLKISEYTKEKEDQV